MNIINWIWNYIDGLLIQVTGRKAQWEVDGKLKQTKAIFKLPPLPSVVYFGIDDPDEIDIELEYAVAKKLGIPAIASILKVYSDNSTTEYTEWRVLNRYREDHRYFGQGRLHLICCRHQVSMTTGREPCTCTQST